MPIQVFQVRLDFGLVAIEWKQVEWNRSVPGDVDAELHLFHVFPATLRAPRRCGGWPASWSAASSWLLAAQAIEFAGPGFDCADTRHDYWLVATLGEAYLLRGDFERAAVCRSRAIRFPATAAIARH